MDIRNCSLEIKSLGEMILYTTDFATLAVLPWGTSWSVCFADKYLWKTSSNKLRGKSTTPTTSQMEFFVTLANEAN